MLSQMAEILEKNAAEVERVARERDVLRLPRAAGELSSSCAGCHLTLRWAR